MDETFRKLIRPMDARSSRGLSSRGTPWYKGGVNSPTPVGVASAKLAFNPKIDYVKLARARLGL